MATGHVVRRQQGRNKEKVTTWVYAWNRRLGKICLHPDCETHITDKAKTCPQHVMWWRKVGQGHDDRRKFRSQQFDRAMDAGVPIRKLLAHSKNWERMTDKEIAQDAQRMIDEIA